MRIVSRVELAEVSDAPLNLPIFTEGSAKTQQKTLKKVQKVEKKRGLLQLSSRLSPAHAHYDHPGVPVSIHYLTPTVENQTVPGHLALTHSPAWL